MCRTSWVSILCLKMCDTNRLCKVKHFFADTKRAVPIFVGTALFFLSQMPGFVTKCQLPSSSATAK